MREHEERFLRNGVVTLDDIAALSAEDFRESLGIRRLGHRRAMWDAAALLRDAANPQTRREEGENISTLNHQMNIRTLLAWMRLTIQMKTLAVALIFLEGPPYVRLASSGLVIVAFFILFQAFRQYLTVTVSQAAIFVHCSWSQPRGRSRCALWPTSRNAGGFPADPSTWTDLSSSLYDLRSLGVPRTSQQLMMGFFLHISGE
mmetsp:Transcript_19224/g.76997  ORF Transcript_19224/g.76997 Transcript_19224/m.76997 type:complete len:203 (+) Transcript_19224:504-1112(+)